MGATRWWGSLPSQVMTIEGVQESNWVAFRPDSESLKSFGIMGATQYHPAGCDFKGLATPIF